MLEIKLYFGEWKEATKEQAEHFYKIYCEGATALRCDETLLLLEEWRL